MKLSRPATTTVALAAALTVGLSGCSGGSSDTNASSPLGSASQEQPAPKASTTRQKSPSPSQSASTTSSGVSDATVMKAVRSAQPDLTTSDSDVLSLVHGLCDAVGDGTRDADEVDDSILKLSDNPAWSDMNADSLTAGILAECPTEFMTYVQANPEAPNPWGGSDDSSDEEVDATGTVKFGKPITMKSGVAVVLHAPKPVSNAETYVDKSEIHAGETPYKMLVTVSVPKSVGHPFDPNDLLIMVNTGNHAATEWYPNDSGSGGASVRPGQTLVYSMGIYTKKGQQVTADLESLDSYDGAPIGTWMGTVK